MRKNKQKNVDRTNLWKKYDMKNLFPYKIFYVHSKLLMAQLSHLKQSTYLSLFSF